MSIDAHNPTLSASRMQVVFELQAATALRLRSSTAQERIAKIRKLRDAVIAHTEDWYRAAHDDFRKPPGEVDLAEILPVCVEANDAIRNLKKWMKPRRVWPTLLTLGMRSHVQYAPRGRCLIIGPFNYPVNLTLGPLVSAIAAGNTAILKPSELTPKLSALICKVVREVFAEDEVAIFEGEADVSQALLELPFDHIFFTGSPTIGKYVMGAAAKHLTSVTLELGGKSPTIIDESADLKLAATNVMWAKFANSGQTCIAPDYVFVHESVKDAWVEACRQQLKKAYGSSLAEQKDSPHLAHMVNARHTSRIKSLLDDANAQGARSLIGGGVSEADCFIQPTLLDQVSDQSRIMDEEIFGPLLPIIGYRDIGEVIAHINKGHKPLALYIYSRNNTHIDQVLTNTVSGGACVNHALMQFLHGNLPFGGINNSGIGNAHGHYGFKSFSHERGVVRTQFAFVATLFAAGEVPMMIRKAMKSAFKIL
ncbi:aldehyde dehydrogenase family protein [Hydrogenophaga sp. PAMC20947]|uniref:aldehyde dehydrogenase family protein n=1 Tax=Hydrogenophaga sp. PAMC20947 TaxID=2565558 RepID=UPI00109DDB63|nr:aldehyde dehydrogenase family protein [Hydrogenophaga sp. PAMC20947]QCB46884.1 aldehyde dehydrogenase family protein [Hydrogenophaga sp. PAMC20947]